jgi:transglutaminase-like putative cysteine protease
MKTATVVVWASALLLLPVGLPATGMMERLSGEIVRREDSHDVKMQKVERWVRENIEYRSDQTLYGRADAHYHPSVTIRSRKGDCEDGALLVHALAAYAGIPVERLRTVLGDRTAEGIREGHAWTLYRRAGDDAWVVVDWTRDDETVPMASRPVLWLTPGYRSYKIRAYLAIERLRPFKVSYVRIQGEVPVGRLGLPNQLDRLLDAPSPRPVSP